MKIAIVQFPGSNCERETALAVQRAGMQPVAFLWNEPRERLKAMEGYIIVGGFSYEDRSRAGIISALDPVMQVIKEQSELGKPILGICNGAQILVETGLVPGLPSNQLAMALADNKRVVDGKILGTGFYNSWIRVRLCSNPRPNAFTNHLAPGDMLSIPIAHAQGRFVLPADLLLQLEAEGLNVFQYCDSEGVITAQFPVNPNGSMGNIAAVLNKTGNVMAIMPHPERTSLGDAIFKSMRDYIQSTPLRADCLSYKPTSYEERPYQKQDKSHELVVQLIITDNQALTVQKTLNHLGIDVTVTRLVHWEIECDSEATFQQIKRSGVLYNERKEYLLPQILASSATKMHLVRSHEDLIGPEKMQMLADHFSITGVKAIHHGILWVLKSKPSDIDAFNEAVLKSNILANPYAHQLYGYE